MAQFTTLNISISIKHEFISLSGQFITAKNISPDVNLVSSLVQKLRETYCTYRSMRNSNQNEIKVSSLRQLKQHLRQNNNDPQVIRLSNHEIRFRFLLATVCSVFIYMRNTKHASHSNETQRVVI